MRNDRLRIQDIDEAIEEIIRSTPETRAQFDADKFRRSHILRHILVHDYFEVNWHRVYETAIKNIPAIQQPIRAILEQLDANEAT